MIEKILKLLETDKALHFLVGFFVAVILQRPLFYLGFMIAVFVAIGKEFYDKYHSDIHSCDIWDAVATIAGATIGLITIIIY